MRQKRNLSLKAARVESGFTQEALAERLGIGKRTLIGWENGEVEIKPLHIYALAYVFQMEADFLRVPIQK